MKNIFLLTLCVTMLHSLAFSQDNLGSRASWMRGTYGLNWKPART